MSAIVFWWGSGGVVLGVGREPAFTDPLNLLVYFLYAPKTTEGGDSEQGGTYHRVYAQRGDKEDDSGC